MCTLFGVRLQYGTIVSIEIKTMRLENFQLYQNYHNPFYPVTTIRYVLPNESNVNIKIYDMLGKELITFLNERQSAGEYFKEFNASNYSSGIYLCKLTIENRANHTIKMIYLK